MLKLNGVEVKPTIFPDKTSQVWHVGDPTTLRAMVQWDFEHEGEFMHLAQLHDLLKSEGRRIWLHIPYLPYARQDKEVGDNASFALSTFVRLLNTVPFHEVTVFDPHNYEAASLIKNVRIIRPVKEIVEAFSAVNGEVICFPDTGASRRYSDKVYTDKLGPALFVVAAKERDPATGHIERISLDNTPAHTLWGKNVLIVDDICDGGATFVALAGQLWPCRPSSVSLYVSHGIFSRGTQILRDAGIRRIFTKEGEVE